MAAINPTIYDKFSKSLPSIARNQASIEEKVATVTELLEGINKELFKTISLPVEKAVTARNFTQFLTLQQIGAKCSDATLALAVAEGASDIVHKLLLDGHKPNNGLLSVALSNSDLQTAYLLIAYGAECSDHDAKRLKELADPLHISGSDIVLFAATSAYWLTRATGNSYLPTLVDVLGGTWFCYNALKLSANRSVVALTLAALEALPATNVITRMYRTASLATKAFSAIKAAYNTLSTGSLARAAFHSVNALHASYILQETARFEYSESQLIKSLSECRNVTTDDITDIDALEAPERMKWVIDHPQSIDCPPVLERAYPGWRCDNFKSKFHKQALIHHPDKSSEKSSSMPAIINAVYSYWKQICYSK